MRMSKTFITTCAKNHSISNHQRAFMNLLMAVLLFAPLDAWSQNLISTLYHSKDWTEVDSSEAYYISRNYEVGTGKKVKTVVSYTNGNIYSETIYGDFVSKVKDGAHKVYFESGTPKVIAHYKMGVLHGELETYFSNGQLRRKDRYEDGNLLEGKCYTSTGADTTWFVYEVQAEYPGGLNALYSYIAKKVNYPKLAREGNIQGKVYVKFIVDQQGNITQAKVIKSAHPLLDEEALRVINTMPSWSPATLDGENISITYTLPISFRLE